MSVPTDLRRVRPKDMAAKVAENAREFTQQYRQGFRPIYDAWRILYSFVLGVQSKDRGAGWIRNEALPSYLDAPEFLLQADLTNRPFRNIVARLARLWTPLVSTPNDSTEQSRRGAAVATEIMDFHDRSDTEWTNAWRQLREIVTLYGVGFVKIDYDANKGEMQAWPLTKEDENGVLDFVRDGSGIVEYDEPQPRGDLCIQALSPFEVIVDNYMAKSFNEVSRVAHVRDITMTQARAQFDLKEEPLHVTPGDWFPVYDPRLMYSGGEMGTYSTADAHEMVRVVEYWERARNTKTNAMGWWHCLVVGDKAIDLSGDGDFYEFVPRVPFVRWTYLGSALSWFGISPMAAVKDLQAFINRLVNQMDHSSRNNVNRILIEAGAGVPKFKGIDGQAIEVPGINNVQPFPGMGIPAGNMQLLGIVRDLLETSTGVTAVSEGSSASLQSGVGVQLTQNADAAQADPVIEACDAAKIEAAKLLLVTIAEECEVEQVAAMMPRDMIQDIDEFLSLIENPHAMNVQLRIGRGFARDPQIRNQQVRDMATIGALDMKDERDREVYFDAMNMTIGRDIRRSRAIQEKAAEWVLDKLRSLEDSTAGAYIEDWQASKESGQPLEEMLATLLIHKPYQRPPIWRRVFEDFLSSADARGLAKNTFRLIEMRYGEILENFPNAGEQEAAMPTQGAEQPGEMMQQVPPAGMMPPAQPPIPQGVS